VKIGSTLNVQKMLDYSILRVVRGLMRGPDALANGHYPTHQLEVYLSSMLKSRYVRGMNMRAIEGLRCATGAHSQMTNRCFK
jgi:hypothetical protein